MAKQLNVDMRFNADTSLAKRAILDLQNSLSTIAKMPGNASNLFDDTEIKKASQAALELQGHLLKAVNVNTGKLDLSRFASSLKTSNKDLSMYANTLLNTGKLGLQAFLQLAQAIATADTPVTRINAKLADLGVTLKNTAKWQISSSVLHGFMGAVLSAYGYAQDLNESLNNIRIVTGLNIDLMARFAETANRAAKALSTTTTDYTNASLIYYQLGLNDSQVLERTDITIKMANVARLSAEIVSDQMTAVWNNFDNGSKSLEYYADVMTALGAATASSTDEIAEGLEKFAAISSTVGLSYEYATAALATVTDKTRQSADVVGTAFKTMFARIQGLELGETLDDGTNLNKYSEALAAVGVSIKDSNGELRDMDNILNDMASVWETLNRDQLVALALTVAGVRQYSQLMALMENWDAMEMNLGVVETSEGALQELADIYAESWEAAQDRVRAAAEGIYQDLIDDEFFIDLLNGFEKLLEGINGVVAGFGGMKGVITTVGSLFLSYYANKMPDTLNNLKLNLMVFTGQANKAMIAMQAGLDKDLVKALSTPGLSESYKIQLQGIKEVNAMKLQLVLSSKNLSLSEYLEYEAKIQNVLAMHKELAELVKKKEALELVELATLKSAAATSQLGIEQLIKNYVSAENSVARYSQKLKELDIEISGVEDLGEKDNLLQKRLAIVNGLIEAEEKAKSLEEEIIVVKSKFDSLSDIDIDKLIFDGKLEDSAWKTITEESGLVVKNYNNLVKLRAGLENLLSSVKGLANAWKESGAAIKDYFNKTQDTKSVSKDIQDLKIQMSLYVDKIAALAKEKGLSIHGNTINAIKKSIDSLNADNIDEVTTKFDNFANKILEKVLPKINTLDQDIDEASRKMIDMKIKPEAINSVEDVTEKMGELETLSENAELNISGFGAELPNATFKMSTALTEFASTAMAAYSVITTLKSAFETFGDEEASGIEKVGAAISVLMAITSAYNSVHLLSNTLYLNETIQTWANNAAKKVLNLVTKEGTEAKLAENAAWYASPTLWIAGVILGVVAALGLLVAGIVAVTKALNDSYNAEAIAAEKANKELKEQQDNLEETKNKYQELTAEIEDYKESENALDKLTRGTEEWKEQVEELNKLVIDLITKYPELAKYVIKDNVTGALGFAEKDLEYIQQISEQAVKDEEFKTYSRQIESNTADRDAKIAELAKRGYLLPELPTTMVETSVSSNQSEPPDLVGPIIDYFLNRDTSKDYFTDKINKFIDLYKTDGEEALALEETLKSLDNLANALDISTDELISSIREFGDIDTTNRVLAEQLAAIIASSNENYQTSKYKNVIDKLIADLIQSSKTEADFKEAKKFSGDVENNYLKLKYGAEADNYRFADTKRGDVTIEKRNEDGGWDSIEDKRNEIDKSDIINEYNKLAKEESVKKEAEKYDIDGVLEGLDLFESAVKEAGFSLKGAEAFTQAKGLGETVNLAGLSDADIATLKVRVSSGQDSYGITLADLDLYEAKGGSLGARNTSFSELYQAVENPAEDSNADAVKELKTFRNEALSIYNELSEEDKRIFAETMNFKTVMSKDTMEQILEAEKLARADAKLETEAEKYDLNADVLKALAALIKKSLEAASKSQDKMNKSSEKLGKGLKKTGIDMEDSAELAAEMAVANLRMNKGVDSLTDNWKDWKKTLKGTDRDTQDYAEAVVGVSDSLRDILNLTDDELIPADFITSDETIDLLDLVANGSEEAVSKLGYNLAKAQIETQEITSDIANNLAGMFEGQDLSTELLENKFLNIKNSAITAINEMQTEFAKLDPGEGLGGDKVTDWANALNQYAKATGMSVEAMLSMLSKLLVKADVTTTEKLIDSKVPIVEKTRTIAKKTYDDDIDDWTYTWRETANTIGYKDAKETILIPLINTDEPVTFTKVNAGTIAPSVTTSGKGGGGGGGSSPKKAQPTKKSDIVDRYKEQDDKLDDLKRTMDNTADSFDRLYGKDKLEAINKLIQAEKDYKDVLKEKRTEARDALDEDRKALNAAASKVSVEFEYDAEGNLINYTEQMEALYNRLRATEKSAGSEWTESEQKQIDALKEKIEALKEAKLLYEDTRELIEDLSDELKDLAGKPAMPLIKSDAVDIYREISDALDDIEDRLDRIARKSDNALGKNRLNYFKNFQGASEEKLSLLEDEIANSTTDIKQNKTFLNKVTKLLDVDKVQYDKKGNIINYDEITNALWDRIFQLLEKAKKGGITPAEQQALDALYADLDLFTSSSDKYRNSVEYREDLRLEKEELTEGIKVLPVVTNDFLDIYKEADDILDDIEDKTSQIAEEAERATGKDKVANLKELAKLEKERLAYIKKEQEINTSDKQEKRKALGTARKKLGIITKFKFDENGNITNYNEIMLAYEQKYVEARADAAVDGTITAEENEWLEKFKEDGQYLEEYIQQYSDAVEKGEELELAAIDAAYAAEDYLLEALNFTIEFGIEANDRDLQLIEFLLSLLEDLAYMTAKAMTLLDKKYLNLQRLTDIYTDGISTILSDNFTQDEINQFLASGDLSGLDLSKISQTELDMLNSYADGLMGLQEELLTLRDTMDGAVIKAFEEWTAEMQELLSLFEHYDSVINSYTNIIDLVGLERLGITDKNIKEYNLLKVNNATNRLNSSKAYYEETEEKIQSIEAKQAEVLVRLEAAQSSGDASAIAAAQNELKSWDETLKAMREENRNAELQYLSDWEAALQASRDAFLAETDIQLKALEERMAGTYGTIANMQEEFKRLTEKNDRYLLDYEKIYELSKLNRDLTNKMDETTNIKAKKELSKLQEEILDYQKEGRQMSDYDLKYLKKKYELKLAEIALEEAQNAKTQVRLTRDSEGNYSYTYTADEDSMAKAQLTYEDKLYEMTTLSNDYIEQQTSKLLSAQLEYVNKLAEIHKKAAEGQYATTEEYQLALDEVTAYYTDLMIYYGDEIDKAAENNATVYENDYQTYSGYALGKAGVSKTEAEEYINWVQAKSDAEAGFITSITELLPGLSDAHSDATGYVESMVGTIGSAKEGTGLLGQASESYKTLSGNIEEAMQAADTSIGAFKDTTYEKLITDEDSIANTSEETKNNILGIVSATDALDDTIEAVANWQTKYSAELLKIIDKAGDVVTAINNMNLVLALLAADEEDKENPLPGKVTETLENPIDLKDKKNDEKCPKCGKKPCKCKEIAKQKKKEEEAKRKAEEEAKRKAEEEAKRKAEEKKKKQLKAEATEIVKKVNNGELKDPRGWIVKAKEKEYSQEAINLARTAINKSDPSAGWSYQYETALAYIKAYNTGGYTGAWGPDGKLALLHEKELVLNKDDTENMLKIVSMVRDLSAALDSKAYYASLAQLQASQLYQINPTGETFELTVTIHAEFPHATNAIEIETALNNLVNSASQFANRK